MNINIIDAIKALKKELSLAFPGGGVSITITASLDNTVELSDTNTDTKTTQPTVKKTQKKDSPDLLANTPKNIDEIRTMLNHIAKQIGAEKAVEFVSELTGGSKKADDIPADKWGDVLALYVEVSSGRAA